MKRENEEIKRQYKEVRKQIFDDKKARRLEPIIREIKSNQRVIAETQIKTQAMMEDNTRTIAKIRERKIENEREKRKIGENRKLDGAR